MIGEYNNGDFFINSTLSMDSAQLGPDIFWVIIILLYYDITIYVDQNQQTFS